VRALPLMTQASLSAEWRRVELDAAALDLLHMHGVEQPPVPIEDILRRPIGNLWQPDLVDLSLPSFDALDRYAARPTIARLVARYVVQTDWARLRGLARNGDLPQGEMRYLGRALLMPKTWIGALGLGERNPSGVRVRFHVPIPDAAERLAELALMMHVP